MVRTLRLINLINLINNLFLARQSHSAKALLAVGVCSVATRLLQAQQLDLVVSGPTPTRLTRLPLLVGVTQVGVCLVLRAISQLSALVVLQEDYLGLEDLAQQTLNLPAPLVPNQVPR